MKKSIDISEELRLISPVVADINAEMPFTVPQGYFEGLPEKMAAIVKEIPGSEIENDGVEPDLSFVPEATRREMPFDLPQGFFDQFAGNMLKMVSTEHEVESELKSISSVVAGIPKTNPYLIPPGYFEQLTIPVFEYEAERGRVVRMNTWRKIAVAAVFAGLILMSTFFLLNNPDNRSGENAMAGISDSAIENFLITDDIDLPVTTLAGEDLTFALIEINDNTISEMLETVEDDAISEFMKDNSIEGTSGSFN